MGEENYPNLEKICRLCLQEEKLLIDIFAQSAEVQMSIPLRIMACVGMDVQPSDRLPKTICLECRYQLEKSYYFQKRSQLSDSKLRKHLRLLSLGKKSRVFDKYDDDDFDEFLLEDSVSFLQETEDLREKQTNSAWNEELQKEVREKIAEVKEDWTKECKDMLRGEVESELRHTVVSEVKESLRSDMEKEIREKLRYECTAMANVELGGEVFRECRNIKAFELLNELKDYLKSEEEIFDETKINHISTGKHRTGQATSSKATNSIFKRGKPVLSSVAKKSKLQRPSETTPDKKPYVLRCSDVASNIESSEQFEIFTIQSNDNCDETNAQKDFVIVDTENSNEGEDVLSIDLKCESHDSNAYVEYLDDAQNFSLFTEKNCSDPILDTYNLGNFGEIQHYKRPEQITNEGDVTVEAATEEQRNGGQCRRGNGSGSRSGSEIRTREVPNELVKRSEA